MRLRSYCISTDYLYTLQKLICIKLLTCSKSMHDMTDYVENKINLTTYLTLLFM